MNQPLRIAVVGVGPRGLSALERVISHTAADPDGPPVELLLIEPGELGVGIHQVKQPDYLLLNTIASQLTIFSDERMTPGAPVTTGPDFFEWCGTTQGPVRFDAFLPRRLLGEYLQWAAGELTARTPERLSIRHIRTAAESVVLDGDGSGAGRGAVVTLVDGERHRVDLAVVTTGHGLAQPAPPVE
ncbi:FAD/NAD(P)-binding protein, partial [Streptacidiphilus neutrinimicus]|uniref:FAD/NAD(P)-binding protein n=1 Tax=Streptacidiphilus neutrinimicus TaxID=105420 RepID=UPI0005A8B031